MAGNRRILAAAIFMGLGAATPAAAQNVIASVNDDPITNVDIEQHEKILRVFRKPATPQAAFDDVVATRLKLIETSKFKINPKSNEIGYAVNLQAQSLKLDPQQLLAELTRAGVMKDQVEQQFKADAAWLMYIRALNRSLEISENDITAELARRGADKTPQYTLRQVVIVVPNGQSAGALQESMKNANALRARFDGCDAGEEAVRATTDATMQPAVTRSPEQLPGQMKQLLDHTQVGRLTPPQRAAEGIVMIAVCDKSVRENPNARDTIRNDLLTKRLQGVADQKLAEVKSHAVIVRK